MMSRLALALVAFTLSACEYVSSGDCVGGVANLADVSQARCINGTSRVERIGDDTSAICTCPRDAAADAGGAE